MDSKKELELIRKRNAELNRQYEDLMRQVAAKTEPTPDEREKDLIVELESLKAQWETLIKQLKDKNDEYDALLADLREAGKIMRSMGFKVPLRERIKRKITK